MAKMSKTQVVAALADKTGMSKKDVKMFMEKMMDLAVSEVKKSGEFVISGLGKLVKMHRKERMGRNPATGAAIKIPAKTVVKFRLAKQVKDAVL
jgi:DNA-binding protein HU-beta